jgi:hypothetical protein
MEPGDKISQTQKASITYFLLYVETEKKNHESRIGTVKDWEGDLVGGKRGS